MLEYGKKREGVKDLAPEGARMEREFLGDTWMEDNMYQDHKTGDVWRDDGSYLTTIDHKKALKNSELQGLWEKYKGEGLVQSDNEFNSHNDVARLMRILDGGKKEEKAPMPEAPKPEPQRQMSDRLRQAKERVANYEATGFVDGKGPGQSNNFSGVDDAVTHSAAETPHKSPQDFMNDYKHNLKANYDSKSYYGQQKAQLSEQPA